MLVSRGDNKLVIWFNPNKNVYYYKKIRGTYYNYSIGLKNQYGHVVVLVIELEYESRRIPFRKVLVRKLISCLEKIE